MIRIASALFFALALPGVVTAQENEIRTSHVGGNVYMIEGMGGNIAVSVGDDGILMVDDQFAKVADDVRAAVMGVRQGDIRFVLNTHFHSDHTDANPIFGKEGVIISHERVRKRLTTTQRLWGKERPPIDPAGWPVVTFDKSVKIHFNGERIEVTHLPRGHTDGDAMVYFTESNVLHMGDQFFGGHFPYIDLDHGGTLEGYIANQERVLGMDLPADVRIMAGHAPVSTLDDLREANTMIKETVAHVREKMKAGESLEQIREAGLPEKWAEYNWDFITTERWIDTIHRALGSQD